MSILEAWGSVTASNVAIVVTVYLASLALYRIFFHPLARFPGPKLAAITRLYEGYFDLVQDGQYTIKIGELHKEYGPIIRISPHELHVSDPAFFDVLFRQDAHYDKYSWSYDAFGIPGATITTASHNAHKARRQPLSPFFSQARVAAQQDLLHRHLTKLRRRLQTLAQTGALFNLGAAMTALARDVANDFILNRSYNSLDREDFDVVQLTMTAGAGAIWRWTKFVKFVAPVIQNIPLPWLINVVDADSRAFFMHLMETRKDTKRLMDAAIADDGGSDKKQTIVDVIMGAKLAPSEKEFDRVLRDVTTIAGAGFETTASALRLMLFHIYSDKLILERLRRDLTGAGATRDRSLDWKALEQIPYLAAIIHEGLRLSPAVGTRLARISPDKDIAYNQWSIPAGTPVGMTQIIMHMDEGLWPEPKRFNPDRWLSADGALVRHDKGFAPFSKGPRNCLGMQLAWAELYITLADLVQRFDFVFKDTHAEDFEPSSDQFTIGTRNKGHVMANVKMC